MKSWEKSNNSVVFVKNETYTGPWQAQVDELDVDPTLGAPEVGMPAFLAGDADYSYLNTGQIPVVQQRFADGMRKNAVFAVPTSRSTRIPALDNPSPRAMYYAVNRDELTRQC